jgi:aminoglycoside 6'-N-acetyltransferase I
MFPVTPAIMPQSMNRERLPIRAMRDSDAEECVRMSQALFPDVTREEHLADLQRVRERLDAEIFVIERPTGLLAGFVEVGARDTADGCVTSPVGYIEAWYVDPDVRKLGYGRALLEAAEAWARARGYREMASDALLDNDAGQEAHERSGYKVVDRVVQFHKSLG